MTKNYRHSENWNPLNHFSLSINQNGYPEMRTLTSENGAPYIMDGQLVMAPKVSLKLNDYKDWFRAVYPKGKVETEVAWVDVKDVLEKRNTIGDIESVTPFSFTICQFTLRLYECDQANTPISIGVGSTRVSFNDDSISLAEYQAWKRALTQLGFGTDITAEDICKELPQYIVNIGEKNTLTAATENTPTIPREYKAVNVAGEIADTKTPSEVKSEEQEKPAEPKKRTRKKAAALSEKTKVEEKPALVEEETVKEQEKPVAAEETVKTQEIPTIVEEQRVETVIIPEDPFLAEEPVVSEPLKAAQTEATTTPTVMPVAANVEVEITKTEPESVIVDAPEVSEPLKSEIPPAPSIIEETAPEELMEEMTKEKALAVKIAFKKGVIDRSTEHIIGKTLAEIVAIDKDWLKFLKIRSMNFSEEVNDAVNFLLSE